MKNPVASRKGLNLTFMPTMRTPLILHCPAKINLFLEIRGKRPDGFHELGTLFQALEFGDTLRAEAWPRIEVRCDEAIPGRAEDNLIYKAAALLRNRFADRIPADAGILFTLEKRIPMGAGLGGGSSDAAMALRLANATWNLGLSLDALRGMAPELGSDVAFFLFQPTALAEGRGEKLSPAPAPYPFHVVVATPSCHVETAWAYRQWMGQVPGQRWEAFRARYAATAQDPKLYAELHNDFEIPVTAHFPEIGSLMDEIASFHPEKAMLTGSGASVFGLFTHESQARACLETVRRHCRFSALTHFLDRFGLC